MYDIDCLRVMLFGLLIFYHVGMFFSPWDFHIKNAVVYNWLVWPMAFVNQWRLALLFVISGAGTCYALSKRNGAQFVSERLRRLLVPLIVGMLFIVPPQLYFERLASGRFIGGYFDFWPTEAFTGGGYPDGNISWHHLWFLPYLLLFSVALTPVFLYLRRHPGAWMIRKLQTACSGAFGLYVLMLPLFLYELFLAPYFPSTHALVGDWYNLVLYCTLFFYGFLLISLKDVFWRAVTTNRRLYLLCGLAGFSMLIVLSLRFASDDFSGYYYLLSFFKAFNLWSWCLALMGYAAVYLNKESNALRYANEAVYPFYILHQTITVALGYYLKDADWRFFPKFAAIAAGTFGIAWIIYEFGIRRWVFIRPLFGMKNEKNF
jgi:hypothetical protein